MPGTDTSIPLILTKLYRPAVTPDFVARASLHEHLDAGMETPLTLVLAPAGYGKSTLISSWLQSIDVPSTWLSLDQTDNNVRSFISYIVAALRTIVPEACEDTLNIVESRTVPVEEVITAQLSNDLDGLKERIVLVLDDYHQIHEEKIHLILDQLLHRPPGNLKLVILSRRDPPLSLASYRANHQLSEIRMDDLQFSREETGDFLEKSRGVPGSANLIARVHDRTEGWPVGVRLAALALGRYEDEHEFLANFDSGSRPVQQYLLEEVLSNLPPGTRERVLKASIFNRFNNALCSAVLGSSGEAETNLFSGGGFIDSLVSSGFFCIPLDESGEWVRFHHLFRDLLHQQLDSEFQSDEIRNLHLRASSWFEIHGYHEEALQQSIQANDYQRAAEIIVNARHELMNRDQWVRLNEWLDMIPAEQVQQDINLMLLRSWIDLNQLHRADLMARDLELADSLLQDTSFEIEIETILAAEISSMRSSLEYWTLQPEIAVQRADFALEHSPAEQECVRSTAVMMKGAAMQQLGLADEAGTLLWNHLELKAFRSPGSRARLIQVLSFMSWFEANTQRLVQYAEMLLELSIEHGQSWSHSYARYFLGLAHYERNEIGAALEQFDIVTSEPYRFPIQNVAHCSFLASLCRQALGDSDRARQEVDKISRLSLESGNKVFGDLAEAFRIDLSIRQGRAAEAEQGIPDIGNLEEHAMTRHFDESFTNVKFKLARGESPESTRSILDLLQLHLESINHRRFQIDVLGMQALLSQSEGDEKSAAEKIKKAVSLGLPGQLIRPLADLGMGMEKLLGHIEQDQENSAYIGKIFAALRGPIKTAGMVPEHQPLAEPLSPRELGILELFARNLSNKEIARELNISPGTVKRHSHNIYGKLSAHNRREAVAKARNLALLGDG